ncbi:MAG: AAA family ATPase [Chloroflexi bacterium]|nr:AAA family ATPase [Chloroflexota bacterium]
MGRLGSHPHIVTVFDLGEEPPSPSKGEGRDGSQPYMVTELMGGGDVEGAIEKAPDHKMPLAQALQIAVETCQGLEFAHGRGIVHRDLKPGNVWLTADPSTGSLRLGSGQAGRGVAKIGDFGLALAIDRSRLTQVGMMVGTVSYMPPEQATGGEVTARSDLYSLGAMLYEMVTGRPPFVGDDSVAIIGQHLNTPPIAPSWHVPSLPAGLEALILRLLEKDPQKRPVSATEVREALESIDLTTAHPEPVEGQPIQNPIYRRVFVGREGEMKQLHGAFDAALSGQGALQMVVGEPGIGKTSICEELATYVALRGGKTLVGHCYEEGSLSLPYLAFVEAMRSYVLERDADALRKDLGSGASEVARIVSEVRDKVQVSPSPSGDPDEARYRLLQAVTGFLRNASAVQPLCIVLEDLHDADRGTLDLLTHVARNLQGSRLMVVGTYRDVEVDRTHPLSGALADVRRVSQFGRVLLRGLTADEVQRMVSALATQEVTWALAEAIHRQTEGNPLFVQEVLRYLVEEGLVSREEGRWRRTTGEQPLAERIPEGLRDVIGKRLSRLGEASNRLLAIAAVIGREFRLDVLQRVAAVSDEELMAALEEATDVGVVDQRGTMGAGLSFRFTHAFFRQTLYEELFALRRNRLHQQVAQALEQTYRGREADHAAELAEHFAQSTQGEDAAKALRYGRLAAQRSMGVYAYGEAARHLERCLQIQELTQPDDTALRCDLLLALGDALMPAGEPKRVYEQLAEEAYTIAEAVQDTARASRACQGALEALIRYGGVAMTGTPAHRLWVGRADRYAQPGTTARVHADLSLGALRYAEERFAGAQALAWGALEQARSLGDPETLFRAATNAMAAAAGSPHRLEAQLGLAEEFTTRPREGVSAFAIARVLRWAAPIFLAFGQRDRAEAIARELEALAHRVQDPEAILAPLFNQSLLATVDGRLEESIALAQDLLARAEELGGPVVGQVQVEVRAWLPLLYLGRAEEALEIMGRAGVMAGREQTAMVPRSRQAMILAHMGRDEEARAALRSLSVPLSPGPDGNETNLSLNLALLETSVLLGNKEHAALLSQRLLPASVLSTFSTHPVAPARLLGDAAVLLGQPEQARTYYHQALEAAGKIRFRPEIALTRLHLAELLLDQAQEVGAGLKPAPTGDALHREALEHLDFAISEFRAMKMQPSLERALRHREILKA